MGCENCGAPGGTAYESTATELRYCSRVCLRCSEGDNATATHDLKENRMANPDQDARYRELLKTTGARKDTGTEDNQ
jgi:hypothetical protein